MWFWKYFCEGQNVSYEYLNWMLDPQKLYIHIIQCIWDIWKAIYGSYSRFKVLHADGWPDGRVSENNATGGPNSSADTELIWVELVSWGRVWQQFTTDEDANSIETCFVLNFKNVFHQTISWLSGIISSHFISYYIIIYCHTLPQLTNSTQINSVSADELGPPVALFSPTRPAGRMQNFETQVIVK